MSVRLIRYKTEWNESLKCRHITHPSTTETKTAQLSSRPTHKYTQQVTCVLSKMYILRALGFSSEQLATLNNRTRTTTEHQNCATKRFIKTFIQPRSAQLCCQTTAAARVLCCGVCWEYNTVAVCTLRSAAPAVRLSVDAVGSVRFAGRSGGRCWVGGSNGRVRRAGRSRSVRQDIYERV